TTIEWYDFLLYGQMAAIVFAKLYFPSSDPLTGTLQSFAIFAVGFAARPIGAAIFGHYGDRMSLFTIPLSGFLSDRLGRKRVYIFGAIATGLFAFAYYAMLNTAIPALIILVTLLAFFFHDMMWGPLAALTAEVFTPRLRYSGASIGFQL